MQIQKVKDKNGKTRKCTTKFCEQCKIEFLVRVDWYKKTKYCSITCRNKSSEQRTLVNCSYCQKEFYKKNSQLSKSKSRLYFCTRYCKDNAQKIGGIREIMPPHYGTATNRNYSYLVEKTENPKCCGCNENKKYLLCVHHIDGSHENDDFSNLEIVCFNCHAKRHLRLENNSWVYSTRFLTPRDKLLEV